MYSVYIDADSELANRSGDDFYLSLEIEPILSKLTSPERQPHILSKRESDSYCELTHWNAIRSDVTAAVTQLINTTDGDNLRKFTLRSPRWYADPDGLEYLPPTALLAFLHHDLNSCGAETADGYLIGFINSTYNDFRERYELFYRGIACGGMLDVLEKLRMTREFWAFEGSSPGVQIEGINLFDRTDIAHSLFSPITERVYYGPIGSAGELLDAHTQSNFDPEILWGEQDCIDNLSLVRNLSVTEDGTALVPTSAAPG